MAIKGEALTINLYAFNVTNNLPASGLTDISGYIIKDGAAPAHLTAAISEPSAVNMPGMYEIALSSSDMNANWITVGGKSISNPTGVVVYPVMIATEQSFLPLLSGYTDTLEAGQTTIEGKIDTVDSVVDLNSTKLDVISGYTDTLEAGQSTIQSQNSYVSTQISGLPDIDTIVSSGNAEGWNLYSDATLANQTEILTRVTNVSGLVDTLEAGQTTIQSQNSYISTQVSGVPDIDTIVASGNAEGWNLYSDATLANQTEILNRVTNVSGLISALNDPTTGEIVSGIFNEVLAGTKDFRTATIEIWAYCANDVNLSGTVSGVLHTYYDPADSGIFTLEAQPSGRIRTDI